MKILLAVDGSEFSVRAAQLVVRHSAWLKESPNLTVLHIEPDVLPPHVTRHLSRDVVDDWYREQGEMAIVRVAEELQLAGVKFDVVQRIGPVADGIAAFADEIQCDLIVMGTHGRTGLSNVMMGSVTGKVLAVASQPVMLAR